MKDPEIIERFLALNQMAIDSEGIRIPHAVARKGDGLHVFAMAFYGPETGLLIYRTIARALIAQAPDEIVFGLDRYTKEGQGVPTRDCLSVHHWDGRGWRFGVIAYQHEPRRFDPIDWGNAHWSEMLAREMEGMWGVIVNAPHREPSPAMALPLRLAPGEEVRRGI